MEKATGGTAAVRVIDDEECATRPAAPPSRDTKRPTDPALRFERRIALAVVIVPFIGFAGAIAFAMAHGRVTGVDLALLAGFYFVPFLGTSLGYHRLFTHGSFEVGRPLRALLAIAGAMSITGPVIRWVADHRRHHLHSDGPGDPHSPHEGHEGGLFGTLWSLWHAHIGWFFDREKTVIRRFAPDLLEDPVVRTVDRLYLLWVILSLGLPALLGYALAGGDARGAWGGFLWGGLARIFLAHHVTWSVNSVCHYFGERPYETGDESTNNWLLAIPTLGEAWHNNHHAFPASAFHGLEWWQVDITGAFVHALEALGLAWNVKRVTARRKARLARAPAA